MSLAVPGFVPPGSTLLLSHRKIIWVKQNRSLRAPAMTLASTEEKPRVITDVPPPGLRAALEASVIADFGWVSILTYREQKTHYWLAVLQMGQKEGRRSQKTLGYAHSELLHPWQTLQFSILNFWYQYLRSAADP